MTNATILVNKYANLENASQDLSAFSRKNVVLDFNVKIKNALTYVVSILARHLLYASLENASDLSAFKGMNVVLDFSVKIKNALTYVVSIFVLQLKYANLETATQK